MATESPSFICIMSIWWRVYKWPPARECRSRHSQGPHTICCKPHLDTPHQGTTESCFVSGNNLLPLPSMCQRGRRQHAPKALEILEHSNQRIMRIASNYVRPKKSCTQNSPTVDSSWCFREPGNHPNVWAQSIPVKTIPSSPGPVSF